MIGSGGCPLRWCARSCADVRSGKGPCLMARPLSSCPGPWCCYRSRPLGYGLFYLCAAVSRDATCGAVCDSDGLSDCPGTGVRGPALRGSAGRVAVAGLPVGVGRHHPPTTPPPLPYRVRSSILNIHHSPAPPPLVESALTRGFAASRVAHYPSWRNIYDDHQRY